MVLGGAFGSIVFILVSLICLTWLLIRIGLLFLKLVKKIDIEFTSLGLGNVENLEIHHNRFDLKIKSLSLSSIFSILAWQLPVITVHDLSMNIYSKESLNSPKQSSKSNWRKTIKFLRYVSFHVDKGRLRSGEHEISFGKLVIVPTAKQSHTNSNTLINCEYFRLNKLEDSTSSNGSKRFQSLCDRLEIRTDFDREFLIDATNFTLKTNFNIFPADLKRNSSIPLKKSIESNSFDFTDENSNEKNPLKLFDKFLEYFHQPTLDINIRYLNLDYPTSSNVEQRQTIDQFNVSFHHASNISGDVLAVYMGKIRLEAPQALNFHGLCQITVYSTRLIVAFQFNEFHLQIDENQIEQIIFLNSIQSEHRAKSKNIPWRFDREVDFSFQFLNPSLSLKLKNTEKWSICQMSLLKINFHCDQYKSMRSTIEFKNFFAHTSYQLQQDPNEFQLLIDVVTQQHLWNSLIFIPNGNLNILNSNSVHIQFEINGLRLQLNEHMFILLNAFQSILSRLKSENDTRRSQVLIEFSLQFRKISLVFCDTYPIYLHLSISNFRASQYQMEIRKVSAFINTHNHENISFNSLVTGKMILDIPFLAIERSFIESTIKVIVSQDLSFTWSTKLHLFLYRFVSSMKKHTSRKDVSAKGNSSSAVQKIYDVSLKIDKCAHVYIQLSLNCRLHLAIHDFDAIWIRPRSSIDKNEIRLECEKLIVDWQQQCCFLVQKISFKRLPKSEPLTAERILLQKTTSRLETLENLASIVSIQSFSIKFPFDSTFNEVTEKFINVRKWVRRLHKTGGDLSQSFLNEIPTHTISNEVWTDLSIQIEEFELKIVDDYFELKLFQNYCLMADEYHERELREQELQRRIEACERASKPLHNTQHLRQSLAEIGSRVYIHRSRKTYFDDNGQRIRRNLIRWHLKRVHLIALADTSLTGKQNILDMIHKIDHQSTQIPEYQDLCTMWCRYVILKSEDWSIYFRDFRRPLWQMEKFNLWGHICAAETTPETLNSIRKAPVEIGAPYSQNPLFVQRLLSPLKFYHDISSDIGRFIFSYGPAWENTMAQVNLCMNGITPRAKDPSPLLPWWDKSRLYLHGRWSFAAEKMSWLYHVASSPYNNNEEMEWLWDKVYVDWTNGQFTFQADSLSIKLRTSSKYDDCCLLYLPNVDVRLTLEWVCRANANDHHGVRLHTRDAVQALAKNQPHDSYAFYRSQNLIMAAKFECKKVEYDSIPPTCTIYASTLRFCERVKNTMMSITRPTRRGRLFLADGEETVVPRKPLLSRHYKSIELQLILPQFRVKYLTSFARQTGAQVDCELFNFLMKQELTLIKHNDRLKRRPRIVWKPLTMNVHLVQAQMWLLRDANEDKDNSETNNQTNLEEDSKQQRTFFLSLDTLMYVRSPTISTENGTHSVLINHLKAVWTQTNRRTLFLVYERYRRNNILRSNLSNPFSKELEHLQQEKNTPLQPEQPSPSEDNVTRQTMQNSDNSSISTTTGTNSVSVTMNGTTSQPSTLASFLDQLINESQHKASVDLDPTVDASVSLVGLRQCTKDDVDEHTIRIQLFDSQIALHGTETGGYVILWAKLALVDQYRHKPVWRDQQLCDKTSWHGDLQSIQYYATTHNSKSSTHNSLSPESYNFSWIPHQKSPEQDVLSGETSRNVTGNITLSDENSDQEIQCIVEKSNATLSYVFFTEQTQEEETEKDIVIPPFVKTSANETNSIGESDRVLVDSFTFIHNDIQLSTNSAQYRTIVDIVNNLLLYVEPKQEGASNKLTKLRLQIQLANNLPALRESIGHLLERVRSTLADLRRLEREIFYFTRFNNRSSHSSSSTYENDDDEYDEHSVRHDPSSDRERTFSFTEEEYKRLQTSYNSVKAELNRLAEKLGMMCAVYKDMQIARLVKMRIAATTNKVARLERRYELHGGSITWFIKHDGGQIKHAQFLLRNILYTKRYYENGTNEHVISIGQAQVDNLLPDDRYQTILMSNCQQQQTMIRVYCKEGESVGGISVKEHLEINVAPLVIQMTRRFSQMLMAFLFPNKSSSSSEAQSSGPQRFAKAAIKHVNTGHSKSRSGSNEGEEELLTAQTPYYFSVRDLDAMESRAKNTLTFQYIKVPEVSLIVSYKIRGTKQKKIGDLENAHISFPTLEYRDLTCSWHNLVLAIKSDVKTVLLSQAIRQNINLRLPFIGRSTRAQNQQLLAGASANGIKASASSSTVGNGDMTTGTDQNQHDEFDEEEHKHKMKLVLGTKISKDLITSLKRRKEN